MEQVAQRLCLPASAMSGPARLSAETVGREGRLHVRLGGHTGVPVLAALYESWSIPFAVILAVPLGIFGALLAVYLRKFDYDVYTQIGDRYVDRSRGKERDFDRRIRAKRQAEGMSCENAAMEAAQLRLRPILMTSFAFIFGVFPLVDRDGAGAASAARWAQRCSGA